MAISVLPAVADLLGLRPPPAARHPGCRHQRLRLRNHLPDVLPGSPGPVLRQPHGITRLLLDKMVYARQQWRYATW